MKDHSRNYRWLLLISSLVTLLFLVAAALRENYLAQWQFIQRAYRDILVKKAGDQRGREILENFRIELKQVSIPALDKTDRCITCHVGIDDPRMTDVAQPFRVHPGDIMEHHPVDRFGCTTCHHGQGPATNFRDAKAEDVYWPYPLLAGELPQSTCLACHDPQKLPTEQVSLLLEGMELYKQKSCGSCHELDGRGGGLGPQLDNEGAKTKHELILTHLDPPHTTWRWHQAHFRDPAAIVPASQMKNPTVTQREALALTVYMLALWERDVPESYLAPDKIEQKFRKLHPEPLSGEEVYQQYCFACHGDGSYGRWDKTFQRFIPAIRGPSLQATASTGYLETNIAQGRPGTVMPAWHAQAGGLMPEEIRAVVDYLRAGRPARVSSGRRLAPGDPNRGALLFAQNCAGCHAIGVAPALGNTTFQQAATDEFIIATIRRGRRNTVMPAFQAPGATGLTDSEIADLLAFIRTMGGQSGSKITKAEREDHQVGETP